MKLRLGFVTNSSSSSFVIAIKGGLPNIGNLLDTDPKWKKFIISTIINCMESNDNCDTDSAKVICSDKNSLKEYINTLNWLDPISIAEINNKYTPLVENGFTIYQKSISTHDGVSQDLINNICDGENIILLERQSG